MGCWQGSNYSSGCCCRGSPDAHPSTSPEASSDRDASAAEAHEAGTRPSEKQPSERQHQTRAKRAKASTLSDDATQGDGEEEAVPPPEPSGINKIKEVGVAAPDHSLRYIHGPAAEAAAHAEGALEPLIARAKEQMDHSVSSTTFKCLVLLHFITAGSAGIHIMNISPLFTPTILPSFQRPLSAVSVLP